MRYLTFSVLLFTALLILGGCATRPGNQVNDQVAPLMAAQEFSDPELLNVSIKISSESRVGCATNRMVRPPPSR